MKQLLSSLILLLTHRLPIHSMSVPPLPPIHQPRKKIPQKLYRKSFASLGSKTNMFAGEDTLSTDISACEEFTLVRDRLKNVRRLVYFVNLAEDA